MYVPALFFETANLQIKFENFLALFSKKKNRSDDPKNMLRVQIFGLSLTSILIILGVLWWFQWFPFGSSSVDGEDFYMQNTALLANNMLAMEYEMVNDDQDVNVHKQLRETALATAVLLKKV